MPSPLFTIGHSTHPMDEFLALLAMHGIENLADIRRFPGSRRFPQFNKDNLALALPKAGIEYLWLEALGGRRSKESGGQSQNLGLRNESFRNYADYMLTDRIRQGVDQLREIASGKPMAFMCSESVFWRCHRRLVSDYLLVHGSTVQHIMPNGELRPHSLTESARFEAGKLIYPLPGDQADLSFE